MPWQRRITQVFAQDLTQRLESAMRKVILDTHQSVVFMTPVDTGRARAGWSSTNAVGSFRIGATFTVSNPVVYIEALENGHSTQAPHGMVAVSINKIPKRIQI